MDKRFIDLYMDFARRTAQMSRATRAKVGAVIIKNNNIISHSWNGTPAGWDNACEERIYPNELMGEYDQHPDEFDTMFPYKDEKNRSYFLKTKPEVLHAERNALDKLAKSHESGDGAIMFVTHSPCMECAKSIFSVGIKQVYYENNYRLSQGIDFLRKCGVHVEQVPTNK